MKQTSRAGLAAFALVATAALAGNEFAGSASTAGGYPTWDSDLINIEAVTQTGRGVYVAVLDTGLAPNWRDYFPRARVAEHLGTGFEQSVVFRQGADPCQVEAEVGPLRRTTWVGSTGSQHGTHVASTIVGYNYRMPNLNAALGCAQLEQLPGFLAAKRALAKAYEGAFQDLPGLRVLPSPPGTESNYWLVTLLRDHEEAGWLDRTLQELHDAGLRCRPVWQPLHLLPMYRDNPRAGLGLTESLAQRIISLPSSVSLGLPLLREGTS